MMYQGTQYNVPGMYTAPSYTTPTFLGQTTAGVAPASTSGFNFGNFLKGNAGTLGSLAGLIGGQISYKNPAESASPYLQDIAGTITPYYQPYIGAGQNALSSLMGQYGSLVSNPASLMSSIGSQYQASPGYQFNVDQATKAMNQAAAAGGMAGSPQSQQQLASVVSGLANQDYYNYLNQALGLYGTGLSGLGNINQMGYGASTGLADNLASALMSQAALEYAGQTAQNQSTGGFLGGLGSLIGDLGSFFI